MAQFSFVHLSILFLDFIRCLKPEIQRAGGRGHPNGWRLLCSAPNSVEAEMSEAPPSFQTQAGMGGLTGARIAGARAWRAQLRAAGSPASAGRRALREEVKPGGRRTLTARARAAEPPRLLGAAASRSRALGVPHPQSTRPADMVGSEAWLSPVRTGWPSGTD